MGEIAEASFVSDRTDGSLSGHWIAQHTMRARLTLIEQEPGESGSIAVERHLRMARGDSVGCCEAGERQLVTVQEERR